MKPEDLDSWLSELGDDADANEELRRVALRLLLKKAQKNPEFKTRLIARPIEQSQ